MANVTKTIGRVPVWRGEFAQGTTYHKHNIVGMYGSSYIALADNTTTAPATVDGEGNVTVDTEKWGVFADASASYKYGEQIDEILAITGEVNTVLTEINGEETE